MKPESDRHYSTGTLRLASGDVIEPVDACATFMGDEVCLIYRVPGGEWEPMPAGSRFATVATIEGTRGAE